MDRFGSVADICTCIEGVSITYLYGVCRKYALDVGVCCSESIIIIRYVNEYLMIIFGIISDLNIT